jgi:hypothetical protein
MKKQININKLNEGILSLPTPEKVKIAKFLAERLSHVKTPEERASIGARLEQLEEHLVNLPDYKPDINAYNSTEDMIDEGKHR